MLNRIRAWFCKSAVPAAVPEVDEAPQDDPLFLFGCVDTKSTYNGGPILKGMSRSLEEMSHACHINKCVRPSSFTVMSLQELEVDIPFAVRDRMRRMVWTNKEPLTPYDNKSNYLPAYKQYFLCDRHYDELVRGKPGTAYVVGPDHIYDPEKDERTQRKIGLAKAM